MTRRISALMILAAHLILLAGTAAAAQGHGHRDWLSMERDGVTVEYTPGTEAHARALLPGLAELVKEAKTSAVPPEIAALRLQDRKALKLLASGIGLAAPGKQMQTVFHACLDSVAQGLCTGPTSRFQVWRRGDLVRRFSEGDQPPGISYHPETEVFTMNTGVRVQLGDKVTVQVVSGPVPVIAGDVLSQEEVGEILDGVKRYLRNRQETCGAIASGVALHEAAEAGMVGDLSMKSPGRRWFAEGAANWLAAETLRALSGERAASVYSSSFSPANYKDMIEYADLLGWRSPEYRGSQRTREALYAFSTLEVQRLVEKHGKEVIRKILHQTAVLKAAGDDEPILSAVSAVTGTDQRKELGKYGSKAREEALRSGYRLGPSALIGNEWQMSDTSDSVPIVKDGKHGLMMVLRHDSYAKIVKLKAVLTAIHKSGVTPEFDVFTMDIAPERTRSYVNFRFDPEDDYEPGPAELSIYINDRLYKTASFRLISAP